MHQAKYLLDIYCTTGRSTTDILVTFQDSGPSVVALDSIVTGEIGLAMVLGIGGCGKRSLAYIFTD
eukprot:11229148-Ditylum_brightwellii.AAC.1